MRKTLKRLVALAATLCMCMSLIPAGAANAGFAPVDIDMTGTDVTVKEGQYKIKVKTSLELSEDFIAAAVSGGNANDGAGKSKLLGLRFQCTLVSDLLKAYDDLYGEIALDDFKFTGKNAGSFELVEAASDRNTVTLTYKLNDDIDWLHEEAGVVGGYLDGKLVIETEENSKFLVDKSVLAGGTSVDLDARVDISYEGGPIPFYDEEVIQGAEGDTVVRIPVIPVGDSGGSGSVKPSHNIVIENESDKGSVDTNVDRAEGGEKVVIKVEDIEEGHRVVEIIVTTEDGKQILVERKEGDTFEFVMPEGAVKILPVFEVSAAHPDDSGVSKMLNTDDHIAFMVGDDKGTFRPNANITRAEVAQIFYALLRNKNVPITKTFDDVDPNAWYATAVNTMASLGAVKGVGNGNFEPNRKITRAEFATIAAFFADSASDRFGFKDVGENHWAHKFISAASRFGWVAGVGGNIFEPDRPILRAEAATIVNNMMGRIGDYAKIDAGLGRQFPDVDKSHWAWYEIGEASDGHGFSFNSDYTVEIWHD